MSSIDGDKSLSTKFLTDSFLKSNQTFQNHAYKQNLL